MTPTSHSSLTSAPDCDALLRQVHERLGGLGIDITTYGGTGEVQVRWHRTIDGEMSDQRDWQADSLSNALQAILTYEDHVDAAEEGAS